MKLLDQQSPKKTIELITSVDLKDLDASESLWENMMKKAAKEFYETTTVFRFFFDVKNTHTL